MIAGRAPDAPATDAPSAHPILLIDASIYIHRAWQRWPASITDSQGRLSNAVAGFADMLCELVSRETPSHVLCALDTCGRQGRRNVLHPSYKHSRPPTAPGLSAQLERCRPVALALGLTAIGSDTVEADDIIGHFARMAQAHSRPITVVSGDKDLTQFVGRDDSYWDFGRNARQDAKAIERRLGVRPGQVPDWLALCGDRSDDIPGVPGIGPATAARLIRKWGSLDVLFANLEGVSGMRFRGAPGVARLLFEHADTVWRSRRLTGLIDDASLPDTLEPLRRRFVDRTSIRAHLINCGLNPAQSDARAAAWHEPSA